MNIILCSEIERLQELVKQKKNKGNDNQCNKPVKSIGVPKKGAKIQKRGGFFDK